ncbi:hypothetical protein RVIR1_07790 [Candidatus Rickettsiella viridis]|uniref:Uncharacterized protein n=1 Tax=Candidatus Rickettsiella viridis TaxID=676208 RepID=A0A2Z5UUU3_9COXI|nr:hypothetical protein RVIR1_07790 [Candidatus Rickettsiella viridis]
MAALISFARHDGGIFFNCIAINIVSLYYCKENNRNLFL